VRGRVVAGAILVAVGVALLLVEVTEVGSIAILPLGGVAFLAAHLATRAYGFLVPGGILTGLGTVLLLADLGVASVPPELGLAAGFLLIPVLQAVLRSPRENGWWWPLIPAGVLGTFGLAGYVDRELAGLVLPGILIVAGLAFVASGSRRAGARAALREAERAALREAERAAPAPDAPPADEPGAPGA